jgi:predicted kinase
LSTPSLVVVCGLSFGGKTTLGSALARRFNYEMVDVDLTKVRLYGVRFEENALDQKAWNGIYDETDREIAQYLRAGASVVDASRNFRREERSHARRIAALNGADLLLIYIDTPEHVARKRLLANRQRPERVDWGDTSFDEIVQAMEPPGEDEKPLVYHYENSLERWISKHSAELTPGGHI